MRRRINRTLTLVALVLFPPFIGCGPSEPDPAAVIADASDFLAKGKPQQAIDILEAFDERKPGNPQINEQLAFAWAQKGDLKQAAYYFNRLAELRPDQPDSLLFAAQSLQQAGDAEGAMVTYQQYLTKKPDDISACMAFAAIAAANGRYDSAIGQYNYVYGVKPSGDVAVSLGNLYLKKNDTKQAMHWYETTLKTYPENAQAAYLGLLEAAMISQNYAKAETLVARIKKDYPGAIEASSMKNAPTQIAKWRQKQNEEKRAADAAAAKKEQEIAAAAAAAAKAAQAEAQTPKIEILRADGTPVEPGTSAAEPKRLSKAEAVALEEAAEEQADADAAAWASAPAQPAEVAPAQVRPAVALPVAVAPSPFDKARAAHKDGRDAEAARLYQNALAKSPSAVGWNEFSVLSASTGNKTQALAASLEAMRMAPDNLEYAVQYLEVAQTVYESRRLMAELLMMSKRFPDSPVITLALARAYWAIDRNAGMSRLLYDKYLDKAPKNATTDEIRRERDAVPNQ